MVYAARELDSLPTPVSAIAIERLPGIARAMAPGRYRIELTIDEHGVVHKLDLLAPSMPGPVERELRAALEETRFIPARKDGRAVKSRVVLQVDAGSEAGEP